MSREKLIDDIILKCVNNDIAFHLYPKKSHLGCGGTFDTTQLFACTKSARWLEILIHESCHMDQFLNKTKVWGNSFFDKVDMWKPADRKKHPILYKRAFQGATKLEIDCDRRSVKKIIKYGLDTEIDLCEYYASANCYHASYFYFYKYGCFYDPNHIPYTNKELMQEFANDRILPFKEAWAENKPLDAFIKKYNKPL